MAWDRSAVVQLAWMQEMAAWSNSGFVQTHFRSVLREAGLKAEDGEYRAESATHAETHPCGESELLIHAVTQGGVLPGGAALVVLELCPLTLTARAMIYAMIAMSFKLATMVDKWLWMWRGIN